MQSEISTKQYGLLNLLLVKSFNKSDTISSAHFVGNYGHDKTSIFLAGLSKQLSYSGNVTLIGNKKLPSPRINELYLNNTQNTLNSLGEITDSESILPEINSNYKTFFETPLSKLQSLKSIERKNDSIYFNSFQNETIEIQLASPVLENIVIKGNFILYSKDSLQVRKSAVLEDVIIKSPKISITEGFTGTIQAFSTEKIDLEQNVNLNYPSVLCLYNKTDEQKSEITIGENSNVFGAVVLFGNAITAIDDNKIIIHKNSTLIGDLYCTGKVMIEGKIFGSVYTNRFFHRTESANYENCIINATIDVTKRPSYFVSIPLFENKNTTYGVYKKVL